MAFEHELSQEEIDALLQGVTGETEPARPAAATAPEGPLAYKLGTDERVVRGRLHTLEVINERFARQLRSAMRLAR